MNNSTDFRRKDYTPSIKNKQQHQKIKQMFTCLMASIALVLISEDPPDSASELKAFAKACTVAWPALRRSARRASTTAANALELVVTDLPAVGMVSIITRALGGEKESWM